MALNTTTAHQWVSVVSQNDFRGDHRFFGRSTLPVKRHKGDMGSNRDSEAKEIAAEEGISRVFDNKSVFRRVSKQSERAESISMSRRDGIDFTDQLTARPTTRRTSTTLSHCRMHSRRMLCDEEYLTIFCC